MKKNNHNFFAITATFSSCSFFSNAAKEAANTTEEIANKTATKAGEIVGSTARSFGRWYRRRH